MLDGAYKRSQAFSERIVAFFVASRRAKPFVGSRVRSVFGTEHLGFLTVENLARKPNAAYLPTFIMEANGA